MIRVFPLMIALILSAASARAVDIYLDFDLDQNITTFENHVVGPVAAPIDLLISVAEGDTLSSLTAHLTWEFASGSTFECFDLIGNVNWANANLPDSGPFRNIQARTCDCVARCICLSVVEITADVDESITPGTYRFANLLFTREGMSAESCDSYVWPRSEFSAFCVGCESATDPRSVMVIEESVSDISRVTWGRIKATYR